MFDSFVFLAPLLLLAVVGLLAFVGCGSLSLSIPPFRGPHDVKFGQVLLQHPEAAATGAVTAPFTAVITAGDLIVVWIWFHTSSGQMVSSVTDSVGNLYEPADVLVSGQGAFATARQQVWFAKNVISGGGSAVTLTATFSGPVDPGIGVCALEYMGASVTDPLAGAANASGFGGQASSPGLTLPANAALAVGAVLFSGNGTNDPLASSRIAVNGNVAEDYMIPLPLQIKATPVTPAAQDWIAQMVAFR